MKIYLLKIYVYDVSSHDLIDVKVIPCLSPELANREMIKHNFDISIENELVPENHDGYDGWEIIDFEDTGYEIEEIDVIEE